MGIFSSFRKKDPPNHNKSIFNKSYQEDILSDDNFDNNEEPENIENNSLNNDCTLADQNIDNAKDLTEDCVNNEFEEDIKDSDSGNNNKINKISESEKMVGNSKVLAVINQKGGVGKSATSINLSCALGENDKRILLIDLDPQGNSSSGLGVDKNRLNKCIYDVLLNEESINDVVVKNAYPNVDVVPATINLAGAEVELVSEIARENRLKEAIDAVRENYDYVFIDCPPSLGLLTVNALVAADKLLIPIQTEYYALEGVTKLLDSMKRVKSRLNKNLDIFGVLLTMYDGRTTLSKQVAEEVIKYFNNLVFDVKIPRTVKISEAPSYGQPITQYDSSCRGAEAYLKLAKEVIARG